MAALPRIILIIAIFVLTLSGDVVSFVMGLVSPRTFAVVVIIEAILAYTFLLPAFRSLAASKARKES